MLRTRRPASPSLKPLAYLRPTRQGLLPEVLPGPLFSPSSLIRASQTGIHSRTRPRPGCRTSREGMKPGLRGLRQRPAVMCPPSHVHGALASLWGDVGEKDHLCQRSGDESEDRLSWGRRPPRMQYSVAGHGLALRRQSPREAEGPRCPVPCSITPLPAPGPGSAGRLQLRLWPVCIQLAPRGSRAGGGRVISPELSGVALAHPPSARIPVGRLSPTAAPQLQGGRP